MTTGLKQVSRGTVWLAHKLGTCAELTLRDVQDEGVRSRAEVTGALSQGETGGVGESHDTRALGGATCPRPQPLGALSSVPGGQEPSGSSLPGSESWLCPFLAS